MTIQRKLALRPCVKCAKLVLGVVDCLCAECEKNSQYYKKTRQKGDPREFLDYPELLEAWRARRRECILWRKEAIKAGHLKFVCEQLEVEKSFYLLIINSLDVDLSVVEGLDKEIKRLNQEIAHLTRLLEYERKSRYGQYPYRNENEVGIPKEQWRRLIQLVHPDKHDGSVVSVEVTKWLLQNKPD